MPGCPRLACGPACAAGVGGVDALGLGGSVFGPAGTVVRPGPPRPVRSLSSTQGRGSAPSQRVACVVSAWLSAGDGFSWRSRLARDGHGDLDLAGLGALRDRDAQPEHAASYSAFARSRVHVIVENELSAEQPVGRSAASLSASGSGPGCSAVTVSTLRPTVMSTASSRRREGRTPRQRNHRHSRGPSPSPAGWDGVPSARNCWASRLNRGRIGARAHDFTSMPSERPSASGWL